MLINILEIMVNTEWFFWQSSGINVIIAIADNDPNVQVLLGLVRDEWFDFLVNIVFLSV